MYKGTSDEDMGAGGMLLFRKRGRIDTGGKKRGERATMQRFGCYRQPTEKQCDPNQFTSKVRRLTSCCRKKVMYLNRKATCSAVSIAFGLRLRRMVSIRRRMICIVSF